MLCCAPEGWLSAHYVMYSEVTEGISVLDKPEDVIHLGKNRVHGTK